MAYLLRAHALALTFQLHSHGACPVPASCRHWQHPVFIVPDVGTNLPAMIEFVRAATSIKRREHGIWFTTRFLLSKRRGAKATQENGPRQTVGT